MTGVIHPTIRPRSAIGPKRLIHRLDHRLWLGLGTQIEDQVVEGPLQLIGRRHSRPSHSNDAVAFVIGGQGPGGDRINRIR